MNSKQNHQQSNIEQARELLSPYLDGEVSGEEKQFVEQQLHTSAELQADLESLRQTVALLSALPKVAAPRPFTLSEADVGGPITSSKSNAGFFSLSGWLRGWVALAASLLLVAVIGSALILGPSGGQTSQEIALAPASESDSAANEAVTMEAAENAMPEEATEPTPQALPLENEAELADPMPAEDMAEEDAPAEDEEADLTAASVAEESATPAEDQVGVTAAEPVEKYGVPEEEADLAATGAAEEQSADDQTAETALAPPSMARQATESEPAEDSTTIQQMAAEESVEAEEAAGAKQASPTEAPPTETPPPPPTDQPSSELPLATALPIEWLAGIALLLLLVGLGLGIWQKIRRAN